MSNKFIIIYSDGPMGSSLLGSLLEQYGYLNLPFRKFFLKEYVMGTKNLNDKAIQYKFLETINWLSKPEKLGGTSVSDRDSRPKIIRANKPSDKEIYDFLSFNPTSLDALLTHCFLFGNKFIRYKSNYLPVRGFIIQEVSEINHNSELSTYSYIAKLSSLNNFSCYVMNRSFKEWVSSLLSQQDSRINSHSKIRTVSIEKLFKRWKTLQQITPHKNLFIIDINSIFLPNTKNINKFISESLSIPLINIKDFSINDFDLFGTIISFKETFSPADLSYKNSNIISKFILSLFPISPKIIRFFLDIIFNILRYLRIFKVK